MSKDFPDAGHVLHALEGFPFLGRGEDVFLDLVDGFLELAHEPDLFAAQELIGGRGEAALSFLDAQGLDAGQGNALAEGSSGPARGLARLHCVRLSKLGG